MFQIENAEFPVYITYRDRSVFLAQTIRSYHGRGFTDITVIDNDSAIPLHAGHGVKVVHSDNTFRHLAPWELGLVPKDRYYIVADCDIELDCPHNVGEWLRNQLEMYPDIPKIGLGIRTDDLLDPPPDRYVDSYRYEHDVMRRYAVRGSLVVAPIDTHFAMHRPGSGWGGITGARTLAPYLCRHLPWYEREYTPEEITYYSRAGVEWTEQHCASELLELPIIVGFRQLSALTVRSLLGRRATYRAIDSEDDMLDLFAEAWDFGRSFLYLDPQETITADLLEELRQCPERWCRVAPLRRGIQRFSRELIAQIPDLPGRVRRGGIEIGGAAALDAVIAELERSGVPIHWHVQAAPQ